MSAERALAENIAAVFRNRFRVICEDEFCGDFMFIPLRRRSYHTKRDGHDYATSRGVYC